MAAVKSDVAAPAPWRRRLAIGVALGLLAGLVVKELDLMMLVSYWGPRAPMVLVITVLAAALYLTRARALVVGVVAALALLWVAVALTPLDARLLEGLLRADAPANADAVFVFSSSLQPDGEPSSEAMTRLLRGLELIGEHRAPRLILSEQRPPQRSYAALARTWMEHLGVHAELMTVGPIDNTHEEGVAVGALFRERGWKRVIAVTAPTHERRAAAVLEHEGVTVIAVPSIETRYDLQSLTRSDDRVNAFGNIVHERMGLYMYRRRHWIH